MLMVAQIFLIRTIITVFELMRSQILLKFAVYNSHTRKLKSIIG
jgi:hypothetical protein